MIVVTGAAGFVGSCLVKKLNEENFNDLILVDDFSNEHKNRNLEGKKSLKFSSLSFFTRQLPTNPAAPVTTIIF